jgi:polyphosphate kinase
MCRLLERLRFLCIVSSNLDEFFEIRVAGLKEQIKLGSHAGRRRRHDAAGGLPPGHRELAHGLIADQYALLNDVILPALNARRTSPSCAAVCGPRRSAHWIHRLLRHDEVMPVLTPIGLDPSHPFPRVLNKSLNFAVELEGTDAFGRNSGAAIVQAPRALPRVIRLAEASFPASTTASFSFPQSCMNSSANYSPA